MTEKYITRIKFHNFKRFSEFDLEFSEGLNLLIGDNDSGKSSILLAIDLVLGGNGNRVELLGLESLISSSAINKFREMDVTERRFEELPKCWIELYLNEQDDPNISGKFNSSDLDCSGLLLEFLPRVDLVDEISHILAEENASFPFEYYRPSFRTFSGKSFTGYSRYVHKLLIDHTQISSEYARRSYISGVYKAHSTPDERNRNRFGYRQIKDDFKNSALAEVNSRLGADYDFTLRHGAKSTLEGDLTLAGNGVQLENMGQGKQCFIRSEFALTRSQDGNSPDVIMLEEPENHLSHNNMSDLINRISSASGSQLIVTTHNSLICSKLGLEKAVMLSHESDVPARLTALTPETSKFFKKSPVASVLEFILSNKVVLVEGAAEYILFESLFQNHTKEALESSGIHVISVGGLSFKRYLELAQILNIKVAVVTDNDGDYQSNIIEKYEDFQSKDRIEVFSESDDQKSTFEISVYDKNQDVCEELFGSQRRSLSVVEYMLANKSEAAYQLLSNKGTEIEGPDYINSAIEWIRK